MSPAPEAPASGRRTLRAVALCLLLLLPLALRLAPIRHGFPATSYVPDTHVVRGALGMARDRTLVPPAGAYTSYPYLLPYLLLPVYGAQYALGRATGAWSGPDEYGARLAEEPERAHVLARVLVALFGALTPYVTFRLARTLGLRTGAWIAAWLIATSLLHVHLSLHERPWVPMAFFVALAAWGAAAHVAGRRGALLGAWLAAGLALATHQGGAFAAAIPGLAWLVGTAEERGARLTGLLRPRSLRALAVGVAGFAAVAVLLGHPYYLLHGPAPAEAVAGGAVDGGGALQLGAQGFSYRFRLASLARMAKAFAGYDPALLVLAVAGLPLVLRRRAALPGAIFALAWGFVFLTNYNDHVRYLLPLTVLLAPASGLAGERLWAAGAPLVRWALVPLLALPLVQATRLAQVIARPDTRARALAHLYELPPGARVAIDVYGPDAPLDLASLGRLAGWRALYGREQHRKEMLAAGTSTRDGGGLDAVRVEDLFDFSARTHGSRVKPELSDIGDDPNAIFAKLGVTHVLLVDRDPGDGVPPFLVDATPADAGEPKMPPLRVAPEPLWVVDPAGDGRPAREARLPTELAWPLCSLWEVERPGPRLALYELERAR
jgi:hypothetical protein